MAQYGPGGTTGTDSTPNISLWTPADRGVLRQRSNSWMQQRAVSENIRGPIYAADYETGKWLGVYSEIKDSLKKGQKVVKWQLRPGKDTAGTDPTFGTAGTGNFGQYVHWEFISIETIANGSGTVSGSENSPKGRDKGLGGKTGGKSKGGSEDKPVDASFVKTDGWDIRANAPMLSVNYPDRDFLKLQTDPFVAQYERIEAERKQQAIRGGGKGYATKGHKGKDTKLGKYESTLKVDKPSVRKRKVTDQTSELPSDKMRLGFIEQDIYLHSDLANLQQGQVKSKQKAKKDQKRGDGKGHRWRFKFHYNPAAVSVSQTYNTELDPLFIAKDPAASIQSGSSVSFDLWINRIEEMQLLNLDGTVRGGDGNVDDEYLKWRWRGAKVDKDTRSLIRTQGTQYDLEYLYRVCNGEPLETWKGLSADYGILFGQPLRLHFTRVKNNGMNVGMNYYGFISSISIDHKMFSMDMVPSLTQVTINFTRIPDTLALDSAKLGEAYAR